MWLKVFASARNIFNFSVTSFFLENNKISVALKALFQHKSTHTSVNEVSMQLDIVNLFAEIQTCLFALDTGFTYHIVFHTLYTMLLQIFFDILLALKDKSFMPHLKYLQLTHYAALSRHFCRDNSYEQSIQPLIALTDNEYFTVSSNPALFVIEPIFKTFVYNRWNRTQIL